LITLTKERASRPDNPVATLAPKGLPVLSNRAVFARKLRINERTLEKWEQGRAKPNPQAAALLLLVRKYPDTLERLEHLAAGSIDSVSSCKSW
jgi:hypothetical protein